MSTQPFSNSGTNWSLGAAEETPSSFRQVVLEMEGMTCAACPKTVRTALEAVDGVYGVKATVEPAEAVVRFDPAVTSVDRLTTAMENVGFSDRPQSGS